MARVYAAPDQYCELLAGIAAGAGHYLRLILKSKCGQCGSWLACDSGVSVTTAIAGKPAPTVDWVCSSEIVVCWVSSESGNGTTRNMFMGTTHPRPA
ncbi:hypothetical protein FFI16_023930 [Pseudomonas sp. KBS0710]|nr:hypothetical protein FFI16_023930 [Pseudomonas sp. KBS0710]